MIQNFSTSQAALKQARDALGAALAAASQAAEQQQAVQTARDRLARQFNPSDQTMAAEHERLAAQAKEADASVSSARAQVQRAREAANAALSAFAPFSDPRQSVGEFSTSSPFVLMPLRLEARFATVGTHSTAVSHQLWVRIYPDDCSIDTFEPVLSTTELANAQRYWRAIWRAGGVEGDERAAWRSIVAAHGSGRAGWIVDTYQPTNLAQKPVKAKATDEILVIGTQTPLSPAEAGAISTYWQALWLAGDDLGKQQAAQAALDAAVGAARAAQLIANYQPYNLKDTPPAPLKKSDVALSTAFVVFPQDQPTKQAAWSQAPRVNRLADRFVVLGYAGGVQTLEALSNVVSLPLIVGPDPSVDPSTDPTGAIHPNNGGLFVPDELRWLVDFERAVEVGMGVKIDLTPEQARSGFDRLLVLGVQLSEKGDDAKTTLEELLQHHHYGRSGLSLVPQGAPTHNTTGAGSGYTQVDDPDASFDDRKQAALFTPTTDPTRKRDGQWLAELLGLGLEVFAQVHNSGGADQMQARAMQRALWPATLGYWMDKLLTPVFDDEAVELTRWFFTNYVSGRGPLPAIRIGKQPYGILPTTAFSRISWLTQQPLTLTASYDPRLTFLARLFAVLRQIEPAWTALSASASYVGKAGDAHQLLLDIIGLHPASIEFYSRYAESLSELFNTVNLWGIGPDFWQAVLALALQAEAMALLRGLEYTGAAEPDLLQHVFQSNADQLSTIIDDLPLSETSPIHSYTDDDRNYIRWLIDAAKKSLDALNQEQGFTANKSPQALLYLYLRHALMLGYYDTSYYFHLSAGFLTAQELQAMKPEPNFIHVADGATSESRFAALYKFEPRITGNAALRVTDYITQNIGVLAQTNNLAEQLDGLEVLADASTASLERAFAEHIDCCSYRFDAWLLGLVRYQLEAMMRYTQVGEGPTRQPEIYLGAYGWLEDLRPASAQLAPVQLPPDLAKIFADTTPLMSDPANGGYIHAPSLQHAKTAAVLRSGYLVNATQANPQTMNVNLSSDRVRLALSLLEGIRNGQSLGALLGYRFERGLHDEHNLAEVDKFIYPLRKAFPLVADSISTTQTAPNVPIEAIEARNVLDGLKLVTQVRTGGVQTYPFGLTTLLSASAAEATAINAEVNGLLDVYDALADLALAEGVHQAVQGNFDRIAATLTAYTTGHFPPEPEVVQTPPSGIGLTHRVAVHFQAGLGTPANATPRSTSEPALDAWLASLLPPLASIGCIVSWTDPLDGTARESQVSLDDLGLHPVDLLDLLKPDDLQSMTELDDRILRFVYANAAPRPDAELRILYMTAPAGKLSIFETAPLVRSLKTLISHARPLRATDAVLHNEAAPEQDTAVFVDRARIAGPKAALDSLSADIGTFLATLAPLVADPVTNRAAFVNGIDEFLTSTVELLARAAGFNLPLCGWGFAFAWRQAAFVDLLAQARGLLARWNARLADYDARIAAYDALPASTPDDVCFKALQAAELLVSAKLDPLPATPAGLRAALDAKRAAFVARRDQFQALLGSSGSAFSTLLASMKVLLPISDFDTQPFDVTAFEDRALVFASDLATNLQGHLAEIDKRRSDTQAQLAIHDAAASATTQAQALQAAAQAMFGADFKLIQEFALAAGQGDEWANALNDSTSGALFQYLTATEKVDFPVDEWLYGAARVRPNLRAWESVVMLTDAFSVLHKPALVPIQFPYAAGDSWLAMQYPPNYVLDSDRLLYTAQYMTPFDKTARQCGLLLDEWTEVIPAGSHTTGITFNFNRPNSEAPQTILLVTPATQTEYGAWQWDDLVGALNETLDLAKKRAVEPVFIDNTVYSRFLPATVMAATYYGISISTSLSAANGVFSYLQENANA
jgi:hypothetical protein